MPKSNKLLRDICVLANKNDLAVSYIEMCAVGEYLRNSIVNEVSYKDLQIAIDNFDESFKNTQEKLGLITPR